MEVVVAEQLAAVKRRPRTKSWLPGLACVVTIAVSTHNLAGEPVEAHMSLSGFESYVNCVAFSPDGATLAASSVNIHVFDVESGARRRILEQSHGDIPAFAFLPDGKALISYSGGGTVRRWDVEGDDHVTILVNPTGSTGLAVSPDGRTIALKYGELAVGATRDLHLWDVESRESLRVIEQGPRSFALAFSPDGRTLAVSYRLREAGDPLNGAVRWFDVAGGELLDTRVLFPEQRTVRRLVYYPCGQWIVAAANASRGVGPARHRVKLWNPATSEERFRIEQGGWMISDVAVSPDGSLLAVTHDRHVELYDAATGQWKARLRGDDPRHNVCLAFSPDGQRLAAGTTWTLGILQDASVRVWNVPAE